MSLRKEQRDSWKLDPCPTAAWTLTLEFDLAAGEWTVNCGEHCNLLNKDFPPHYISSTSHKPSLEDHFSRNMIRASYELAVLWLLKHLGNMVSQPHLGNKRSDAVFMCDVLLFRRRGILSLPMFSMAKRTNETSPHKPALWVSWAHRCTARWRPGAEVPWEERVPVQRRAGFDFLQLFVWGHNALGLCWEASPHPDLFQSRRM